MSIFARAGTLAAVASVRHPVRTIACLLLAGALAILLLASREQFDSDILALLPANVPAVEGLKIYQHEFAQARELAFFFESPEDPAILQEFRTFFTGRLAEQPWVVRWMDAPPTEMPGAVRSLVPFAAPLLLNLPPEEFQNQLRSLEPGALAERVTALSRRARSGSPVAAFALQWDPLGLLAPLSAKLADTIALDEGFALSSPDGSAQIISVITNQPSLEAVDCAAMMRQVRAFVDAARAEFGEGAPEVLITGRSAYVEEIAASMRRDIMLTSIASGLGISLLFLLAFGSLRALAGLLLLLSLSAVLAMALGLLLFPSLNLIALAFCSILFGLGVDFGFLLLESARRTRLPGESSTRENVFTLVAGCVAARLPGIAGVAVTTAIGFLALSFSESQGFTQLGILTAAGILLCAVLLPAALFAAVPRRQFGCAADRATPGFLLLLTRPPAAALLLLALLWLGIAAAALLPGRGISFDISPRSLEPRNTPASIALQRMMDAFPATFEPMLLIAPTNPPDSTNPGAGAALLAERMENRLRTWREEGLVRGFSGASLLLPRPDFAAKNRALLAAMDWDAITTGWRGAADAAGLERGADCTAEPLLAFLSGAAAAGGPGAETGSGLPEDSPWWFFRDRTLSPDGAFFLMYVRPESPEAAAKVAELLRGEFPGVMVTGWSVMLGELRPWAWRELKIFGIGVTGAILLVLGLVYRSWRLWLLHVFLLGTSALLIFGLLRAFDVRVNLLNILAFPLILGVGVDYATHLILSCGRSADPARDLALVFKPVLLSGLTTMTGFGALSLATNPALSGLGIVCLVGIGSCLFVTLVFAPVFLLARSSGHSEAA